MGSGLSATDIVDLTYCHGMFTLTKEDRVSPALSFRDAIIRGSIQWLYVQFI